MKVYFLKTFRSLFCGGLEDKVTTVDNNSNSFQGLQNALDAMAAASSSGSVGHNSGAPETEINSLRNLSDIFSRMMDIASARGRDDDSSHTAGKSSFGNAADNQKQFHKTDNNAQPAIAANTAAGQSGNNNDNFDTSKLKEVAGSGQNTTYIKNTSSHDETIGQFMNGGSTTTPEAQITLKPGETGALKYANGEGGYDAVADASGQYKPDASRLEFYADQNGVNNDDVSYIDGDNAAIKVSDGKGKSVGQSESIASEAPSGIVQHDSEGRATITGWYDGSSQGMQEGGKFLEDKLGTGNAYIHPDDDRNGQDANPMTMAQDSSSTYYATFGDA